LTIEGWPVLVSTDWTECYDEFIQQLLGFFALIKYMHGRQSSDWSVHLAICPLQFTAYLKACCLIELRHAGFCKRSTVQKSLDEVVVHECFRNSDCQHVVWTSLTIRRVQ